MDGRKAKPNEGGAETGLEGETGIQNCHRSLAQMVSSKRNIKGKLIYLTFVRHCRGPKKGMTV